MAFVRQLKSYGEGKKSAEKGGGGGGGGMIGKKRWAEDCAFSL